MAKSPSEQLREIALELRTLRERDATRERDVVLLREEVVEERKARTSLEKENAVLKQLLQDHIKRVEVWDGRRWGLIVLLVGAVLSLSSGLVISLARK